MSESISDMSLDLSQSKKKSRKRHKNSHLGCATCKQRRIKCDEELPACKNCLRAKLKCAYLSLGEVARKTLRSAQLAQKLKIQESGQDIPGFMEGYEYRVAHDQVAKEGMHFPQDKSVLDNIQSAVTNTTLKSNKSKKITATKISGNFEPLNSEAVREPYSIPLMASKPFRPYPSYNSVNNSDFQPSFLPMQYQHGSIPMSQPPYNQYPYPATVIYDNYEQFNTSSSGPMVSSPYTLQPPPLYAPTSSEQPFYNPPIRSSRKRTVSETSSSENGNLNLVQTSALEIFEMYPMSSEFKGKNLQISYTTNTDRLKLAFSSLSLFETYIAYCAGFAAETGLLKSSRGACEKIQTEAHSFLINEVRNALTLLKKPIRPDIISDCYGYIRYLGSTLITIMLWHGAEHISISRLEYHFELTGIYLTLLDDYSTRVYEMTRKSSFKSPPSSVDNCNFYINSNIQVLFELIKYYYWPGYNPVFMQEIDFVIGEFRKLVTAGSKINQSNRNFAIDDFVESKLMKIESYVRAFLKYYRFKEYESDDGFKYSHYKLGNLLLRSWFAIYPHLLSEEYEKNPYKITVHALYTLVSRSLSAIFPNNYWMFLLSFEGLYPITMRDKKFYNTEIFDEIININRSFCDNLDSQVKIITKLKAIVDYSYKVQAFFDKRDLALSKCLRQNRILKQFIDDEWVETVDKLMKENSDLSETQAINSIACKPEKMKPVTFKITESCIESFLDILKIDPISDILSPESSSTSSPVDLKFSSNITGDQVNGDVQVIGTLETPKVFPKSSFNTENKASVDELNEYLPICENLSEDKTGSDFNLYLLVPFLHKFRITRQIRIQKEISKMEYDLHFDRLEKDLLEISKDRWF